MKRSLCLTVLALLPCAAFALRAEDAAKPGEVAAKPAEDRPLVQIALLLDTSGSMGGMIQQAKTQLWSIVNEFIAATRGGKRPIVQVALYRYGTPSLGAENGYIKQLAPLTDDLDKVSDELFKLTSDGGDEFCGMVIQRATNDLAWSARNEDYKAIFIAGNESFAQGKVDFRAACRAAIAKGIIINTIHCAGAEDTHWEEGARLADGRFMHIDQNRTIVQINAPQDAEIAKLNTDMNKTYVAYGRAGQAGAANQAVQETNAASAGAQSLAERVRFKGSAQYRNAGWDLVDAAQEKAFRLEDVKAEELPENMRTMTVDERRAYIETQRAERARIQARIQELSAERDRYVAAEQKKAAETNKDTLGEQARPAVRAQAEARGFEFAK